MSRFIGSETHTIDSKGRVSLPAKMRKNISPEADGTFVIARGLDKCINVYPRDEWDKYVDEELSKLNAKHKKTRYFIRKLMEWSVEAKLDSHNRISLPKKLMDLAEIKKEVLIIGAINRIELWNPDVYVDFGDDFDESYEDIATEVLP